MLYSPLKTMLMAGIALLRIEDHLLQALGRPESRWNWHSRVPGRNGSFIILDHLNPVSTFFVSRSSAVSLCA